MNFVNNFLLSYHSIYFKLNKISDVPDPQFQVRPDPDPDFFFKLGSGRIRIVFSN